MDIAYDEIPERHYKESEVMGVKSLTSGRAARVCMRVNVRDKGGGDEKRGTEESPWRRTEDACEQINRIACYLSRAAPARF